MRSIKAAKAYPNAKFYSLGTDYTTTNMLAEVESRTLGSRPRPKILKNPRPRTALRRTDPVEAKDTGASVLQKKGLQTNFSCDLQKTGQFSRTWGFKAKALTFDVKAKEFKMCLQGLHLCILVQLDITDKTYFVNDDLFGKYANAKNLFWDKKEQL